ncbi:peroxisomal and mitochondrial division factor 2-like [Nymphaea colorata]|nr:peroxisomal and mitochondrial division factor 2-like [Nymphaea colorata]
MNTEETSNDGNQERGEEIVVKSTGGELPLNDGVLAQKVQEIVDLKEKISSLEDERDDLQSLVGEQASKMMSAIESSEESKRRAAETSSRLEEVLQQLDEANSTVSALQQEQNMLKSVASRAAELEIQVVRLQHDLISTMNEKEEMATEMEDLRVSLEEVRKAAESKELVIKDLENERDSLKEKVKEQDHRLEILTRELEESLLQSKSKLEEEKRTLDNANKKLMSIESQCELQDEKIRTLKTHLREGEVERKKAADALMEKEAEVGRLVRELDALKSQLKETLEEKGVLEELSKNSDTKLREENEAMKKKLDVEMGSLDLKEKEIKALEKTVGDLGSKLEAAEAVHKGLIEKFESSEKRSSKGVPAQEGVGKLPWPLAAAASTGTLAAAAFMAYLKYSKQRVAHCQLKEFHLM